MAGLTTASAAGAIHPVAMALHNALAAGHAITIHPVATSAPSPSAAPGVTHAPGGGVSLGRLERLGGGKFNTHSLKLG